MKQLLITLTLTLLTLPLVAQSNQDVEDYTMAAATLISNEMDGITGQQKCEYNDEAKYVCTAIVDLNYSSQYTTISTINRMMAGYNDIIGHGSWMDVEDGLIGRAFEVITEDQRNLDLFIYYKESIDRLLLIIEIQDSL